MTSLGLFLEKNDQSDLLVEVGDVVARIVQLQQLVMELVLVRFLLPLPLNHITLDLL